MRWIGVGARLVVGGVWLVAGLLKIPDPAENVRAVRAYRLLPETVVPLVGHALPVLEILVGVCLLLGLLVRANAVLSAVLLLGFIVGISAAWARGMSIECGCFGGGGGPAENAQAKYPWELARDFGLFILSAWLVYRPRSPLALDNALFPRSSPARSADTRRQNAAMAQRKSKAARNAERLAASEQAKAVLLEQQRRERRRRTYVVTAVVAVVLTLLLGIGYAVQSSRDTTGQATTPPAGAVDSYALPLGKSSAPVTVTVYEDFMCPYCGEFEKASRDTLHQYAADGDVQVQYRVLSFLDRASDGSDYSTRSMNALGAVLDTAGPEVASKFHDLLYEQQPQENTKGLSDDELIALAVQAGAKESAVAGPIRDLKFEQWVKNATDQSTKDGVSATPTVRVDGTTIDYQTIDELVTKMDAAIQAGLRS
ncbi:MauE/DoxX family redox-associated membrane protein [Nocardioides mesophilus]|uniref:Thioredoxin domain-containing protein n=1 Tax=Nocardioides mesophilus TaxID=433659 RepID=A0A7G9RCW5_9ACTN|nr:thioredoxin domain-containing protein [Nocardioides mesophilus]QNN53440.1 thioredoxin domain-containing protein [Nocardioides mesophilus]